MLSALPMLKSIISEMDNRFSNSNTPILEGMDRFVPLNFEFLCLQKFLPFLEAFHIDKHAFKPPVKTVPDDLEDEEGRTSSVEKLSSF